MKVLTDWESAGLSAPFMVSSTASPLLCFLRCLFLVIYRILKQGEESNDPEQTASYHFTSLGHKILMSVGSSRMRKDNQQQVIF